MEPNPSDSRDDVEREPAQGYQAESAEHAPEATPPPLLWGSAAAYQHEDDELVWPTD